MVLKLVLTLCINFENYTISRNIDMLSNQEMVEIRCSGALGGLIGGVIAAYHEIGTRCNEIKKHQHSKHYYHQNADAPYQKLSVGKW